MHIDFHFYGTYAMARAAGLNSETATVVATAAQFVDDNAAQGYVRFQDGARIDKEATAHHLLDTANLDEHDQRRVWVPFHFFPGKTGDSYTEQLKCRMDSPLVQEMRDHHLGLHSSPFAKEILGITAHVYADTFSHYGFSGVSSRGNKVKNDSFQFHGDVDGGFEDLTEETHNSIIEDMNSFFKKYMPHGGLMTNIKSLVAEVASGALGHGSVAKFPDFPFLVWSFDYERPDAAIDGVHSVRNNPATYLQASRKLHEMFKEFAARRGDVDVGDGRDFGDIEGNVRKVLNTQANKAGRISAWKEAARSGELFGSTNGEEIPDYQGEQWNESWAELDQSENCGSALGLPVWRFYQAASLHRTYVLRELLPEHGLIVD